MLTNIEIELLIKCNLSCFNCNRACSKDLAPSDEEMSIKQLEKFVIETYDLNFKWTNINLLGGEPTLRNDLIYIITMLNDTSSNITVITNGVKESSRLNILHRSKNIILENTNKKLGPDPFFNFFEAPVDNDEYSKIKNNYKEICINEIDCGLGFNRYGFYVCGVAATIDRVFGFDIGIKRMKDINQSTILQQKKKICKFCGILDNSKKNKVITTKHHISKTWKEALGNYKKEKPILNLY